MKTNQTIHSSSPILILLIILINYSTIAQTTYTWIGLNNGSWATATNWSPTRTTPATNDLLVFNSQTTLTITAVPTQTIGRLTISNNSNITLNGTGGSLTIGNQTGDDFVIVSGSSLTLGTSGNITLNTNATANISGTLNINSGRTYNTNGTSVVTTVAGIIVNFGTITNATASKLVFVNGSTYQHLQNGGTIPTATWDSNSTCLITGTTSTNPANMGQTFGNLTWNCLAQTSDANFDALFTVKSNFTLSSTGSGVFRFPAGTSNISGNYLQTGGICRLANTSDRILNVAGNFTLSGGELRLSVGAANGTINIAGNFTHTTGTITETSTGYGMIVFNGTSNQTYTGGGTLTNTINFTLNNSAGLTLNSSVSFPAALTLTNGNITTGSNVLTLGTSVSNLGSLSRASGTIVGNFKRWFAAGTISNVLFPIGTAANYRPANISFTAAITTGGTLTAFFNAINPGTAGLPLNDGGVSIINAGKEGYWTINSGNGFSGGTYSLDLTADGFSGVSVVSTLRLLKRTTGGSWTLQGTHSAGTGTVTTPIVHRTGMSGFSEFGVGGASDNPLPVELSYFTAKVLKGGGIQLNWRTETEVNNYGFEIERNQKSNVKSQTVWEKIGFANGNGNSNSPKEYSFTDNVISGKYSYRLKQIDTDGSFEYSKVVDVDAGNIPNGFVLEQNYPNPFNPSTKIKFALSETQTAKLTVYDILGNVVAVPFNETVEGGKIYEAVFNGENYSSGIYFYRLETKDKIENRKMLMIK